MQQAMQQLLYMLKMPLTWARRRVSLITCHDQTPVSQASFFLFGDVSALLATPPNRKKHLACETTTTQESPTKNGHTVDRRVGSGHIYFR